MPAHGSFTAGSYRRAWRVAASRSSGSGFSLFLSRMAAFQAGTAVTSYLNLLCLIGPNTGLARKVNYALDYLGLLDKAGPGAHLEVKPEVQHRYNDEIQRKFDTTWASELNPIGPIKKTPRRPVKPDTGCFALAAHERLSRRRKHVAHGVHRPAALA